MGCRIVPRSRVMIVLDRRGDEPEETQWRCLTHREPADVRDIELGVCMKGRWE